MLSLSLSEPILRALDVDRMIVGHTPQDCINSAYDDWVWRIDIGMSVGVDDNKFVEVLEIQKSAEDGSETVRVLSM